ncbi:Serine aminopeptidase S33 domain-containing protein [Entamoeba marina]
MEKPSQSISLRSGAKKWKKRCPSNCHTLPQFFKINESIPALLINPTIAANKTIILYSHDSTERLETIHQWLVQLTQLLRADVIAYEFPGYIDNTEEYSDTLAANTIQQVYNYVLIELKKQRAGCGPTLFMAYDCRKEGPVGGVILVNPIVNASIFTTSPFHKSSHIKAVTSPVIIIYGALIPEKKYIRKLYSLIQNKGGFKEIADAMSNLETEFVDELMEELVTFVVGCFPELQSLFNGEELERIRPAQYASDPITEISAYLEQRDLQFLTKTFISYGYCRVEHFLTMYPDEIDMLDLEEKDSISFKQLLEDTKNNPDLLHPVNRVSSPKPVPPCSRAFMDSREFEARNKRKSIRDVLFGGIKFKQNIKSLSASASPGLESMHPTVFDQDYPTKYSPQKSHKANKTLTEYDSIMNTEDGIKSSPSHLLYPATTPDESPSKSDALTTERIGVFKTIPVKINRKKVRNRSKPEVSLNGVD